MGSSNNSGGCVRVSSNVHTRHQETKLTGIFQSCCSHVYLLNSMLNLISFLLCWCNSSIEHKITFKKCFIGQRFGHFLLIVVVASTLAFFGFCRRRYEWRVASCRRGGLETNWTTFPELLSSCQLNKQGTRTEYWVELNFRRSWEGKSDRNKTSIIAKENRFILESVLFLIWLHILPVFSWRRDVDWSI